MYSVVHYLSDKHPQTPVPQTDLQLQLVLWKHCVCTSGEWEVQEELYKKLEARSMFGRMKNVIGKVSTSFTIIKYPANEHGKIMHVSSMLPCKQESGCFDQTMLRCKILCEIKKIESGNDHSVERGFPNSSCFYCWNVNCRAGTSKQIRIPVNPGNIDDLWTHSKGGVWNHH